MMSVKKFYCKLQLILLLFDACSSAASWNELQITININVLWRLHKCEILKIYFLNWCLTIRCSGPLNAGLMEFYCIKFLLQKKKQSNCYSNFSVSSLSRGLPANYGVSSKHGVPRCFEYK